MIPAMIATVRPEPDLRTAGGSAIAKPMSSGGSTAATGSGAGGGAWRGSAARGGTVIGSVL